MSLAARRQAYKPMCARSPLQPETGFSGLAIDPPAKDPVQVPSKPSVEKAAALSGLFAAIQTRLDVWNTALDLFFRALGLRV